MKKDVILFALPVTFFALLAYFLQAYMLFTPDVGYLLTATHRLLAGGRYGAEIFETNPPMILYIYIPICMLSQIIPIKIMTLARLYALTLMVISSGSCYLLLKKLIPSTERFYFYSIFYTILFIYFIVSMPSYLQREHILLIVLIPYLLAAALALENKSLHPSAAILIGLFAGIGFSLKAFFWVTIVLVEGFLILKKRHLFAWVRIESLILISVIVIYFISLQIFQPEYFNVMTPLVLHYYFPMIRKSFIDLWNVPHVNICITTMLAYGIFWRLEKYQLGQILFLGLLGMTIAFFIPGAGWFYHVLPALSLSFLLLMHAAGQTFDIKYRAVWTLALLIILLYPMYQLGQLLQRASIIYNKHSSNDLITYLNSYSGPRSVYCFTSVGTHRCFPLVYQTNSEYAERFPFFWWYKGLRTAEKAQENEVQENEVQENEVQENKAQENEVQENEVQENKTQENKTQENKALGALENKARKNLPVNKTVAERIAKDKQYLINAIAEDLNRYQARWVIVDDDIFKNYEGNDFDVIHYFSENKQFKQAWMPYQYLTRINGSLIYERR